MKKKTKTESGNLGWNSEAVMTSGWPWANHLTFARQHYTFPNFYYIKWWNLSKVLTAHWHNVETYSRNHRGREGKRKELPAENVLDAVGSYHIIQSSSQLPQQERTLTVHNSLCHLKSTPEVLFAHFPLLVHQSVLLVLNLKGFLVLTLLGIPVATTFPGTTDS